MLEPWMQLLIDSVPACSAYLEKPRLCPKPKIRDPQVRNHHAELVLRPSNFTKNRRKVFVACTSESCGQVSGTDMLNVIHLT